MSGESQVFLDIGKFSQPCEHNGTSRNTPLLMDHFCCIVCRKAEENFDHLLWSGSLRDWCRIVILGV